MKLRARSWLGVLATYVLLLGGCDGNTEQVTVTGEATPKLISPNVENVRPSSATAIIAVPIITYRISNVNRNGYISVSSSGEVEVFQGGNMPAVQQGQSSMEARYTLDPDQLSSVVERFTQSRFFEFEDSYIEIDPPSITIDMDYRTLTFHSNGQTKSIKLRGSSTIPGPLSELEQEVVDLWDTQAP